MPAHIIIDKEGNIDDRLLGGLINADGNTDLGNLGNNILG
jgi:hypothetical protein